MQIVGRIPHIVIQTGQKTAGLLFHEKIIPQPHQLFRHILTDSPGNLKPQPAGQLFFQVDEKNPDAGHEKQRRQRKEQSPIPVLRTAKRLFHNPVHDSRTAHRQEGTEQGA